MTDWKTEPKSIFDLYATRRQVMLGAGAATALVLPFGARAAEDGPPVTVLESVDDLNCVYVDRATGKVVAVKSFADVNPEIRDGKKAKVPYSPPTRNVAISSGGTLFKRNVRRYAIVDIEKRTAKLGFFDSLKHAYKPEEYNLHFLLTLADRELGRIELGNRALKTANDSQKKAAMKLLRIVHYGFAGKKITENPAKMAEATRYYTARELLKPMLFLGQAPKVGDLAMIGAGGVQMAATDNIQIAIADNGQVTGGVSIGAESPAADNVGAAAEGATQGSSATGASIGAAASAASASGGSSGAESGGDSGGEPSGSGGSTGGGGASGGRGDQNS